MRDSPMVNEDSPNIVLIYALLLYFIVLISTSP